VADLEWWTGTSHDEPSSSWPPPALARAEAIHHPGQLLPAQAPRGHRLGRRQRRGTGVPPGIFISSWLNWTGPEFAALRYFALNGTDHRTHAEQGAAIAAYLRWRNARAQPKRDFAPGSVIRT
jgi:hypothetical protein